MDESIDVIYDKFLSKYNIDFRVSDEQYQTPNNLKHRSINNNNNKDNKRNCKPNKRKKKSNNCCDPCDNLSSNSGSCSGIKHTTIKITNDSECSIKSELKKYKKEIKHMKKDIHLLESLINNSDNPKTIKKLIENVNTLKSKMSNFQKLYEKNIILESKIDKLVDTVQQLKTNEPSESFGTGNNVFGTAKIVLGNLTQNPSNTTCYSLTASVNAIDIGTTIVFANITASQYVSKIQIDNITGFVDIDMSTIFSLKYDKYSVYGTITIYNIDSSTEYVGVITNVDPQLLSPSTDENSKLNFILSSKPIMPLHFSFSGIITLDIKVIKK